MPLEKQIIDMPLTGSLNEYSDVRTLAPGELSTATNADTKSVSGAIRQRAKYQKWESNDIRATMSLGLSPALFSIAEMFAALSAVFYSARLLILGDETFFAGGHYLLSVVNDDPPLYPFAVDMSFVPIATDAAPGSGASVYAVNNSGDMASSCQTAVRINQDDILFFSPGTVDTPPVVVSIVQAAFNSGLYFASNASHGDVTGTDELFVFHARQHSITGTVQIHLAYTSRISPTITTTLYVGAYKPDLSSRRMSTLFHEGFAYVAFAMTSTSFRVAKVRPIDGVVVATYDQTITAGRVFNCLTLNSFWRGPNAADKHLVVAWIDSDIATPQNRHVNVVSIDTAGVITTEPGYDVTHYGAPLSVAVAAGPVNTDGDIYAVAAISSFLDTSSDGRDISTVYYDYSSGASPAKYLKNYKIMTNAFRVNRFNDANSEYDGTYIWLANAEGTAPYSYYLTLFDWAAGTVDLVGTAFAADGSPFPINSSLTSIGYASGLLATSFTAASGETRALVLFGTTNKITTSNGTLYPSHSAALSHCDMISAHYKAGGQIMPFDNMGMAIKHIPARHVTVAVAPGSGSLSAGTYGVRVLTEYVMRSGEVIRGALSSVQQITVAAGDGIDVWISGYDPIPVSFLDTVRQVVYSTTANGSIFYRGDIRSSYANTELLLTIVRSDTEAESKAFLYTTGGELLNDAPPPAFSLCSAKNRLFAVQADARNQIWFTKEKEARGGYEWSASFITVCGDSAPVTAIIGMDDYIVAFKEYSIYVAGGPGPNALGQGDYYQFTEIATGIGCTNVNCVALNDKGIWFASSKGAALLTRGLQIEYPGVNLRGTLVGSNVNRVVANTDDNLVLFLSEHLKYYVYDIINNSWSVSTFPTTPGSEWDDFSIVDIGLNKADNESLTRTTELVTRYSLLDVISYPRLNQTTQNIVAGAARWSLDNNGMLLSTPWFNLGNVQGYQRLTYIAVNFSTKLLTSGFVNVLVTINYDYETITSETVTAEIHWTANRFYTWRIKPAKEKCQAISLTFSVPKTINGADYGYVAVVSATLQIGKKAGVAKVGSNQTL